MLANNRFISEIGEREALMGVSLFFIYHIFCNFVTRMMLYVTNHDEKTWESP